MHVYSSMNRDQLIMLLFLPIILVLCCNAIKIHLLCSRTGIVVRLLCFYMQFCMSYSLHVADIFIKTILLECINERYSII